MISPLEVSEPLNVSWPRLQRGIKLLDVKKELLTSFKKRGQGRHRTDEMLGQGCAVLDKPLSPEFLRMIKYYT